MRIFHHPLWDSVPFSLEHKHYIIRGFFFFKSQIWVINFILDPQIQGANRTQGRQYICLAEAVKLLNLQRNAFKTHTKSANPLNLKVYQVINHTGNWASARQSEGRRFMSRSSQFFFVSPKIVPLKIYFEVVPMQHSRWTIEQWPCALLFVQTLHAGLRISVTIISHHSVPIGRRSGWMTWTF